MFNGGAVASRQETQRSRRPVNRSTRGSDQVLPERGVEGHNVSADKEKKRLRVSESDLVDEPGCEQGIVLAKRPAANSGAR